MFFKRILLILFTYLHFCAFAWLRFCAFWCFLCSWCFLVLFSACKIFSSKDNKKFETVLIYITTEFILSRVLIFLIITIFFNYHNLFQLLQYFSIITIFLIIITCDNIFVKTAQCINSGI